MEEEKVDSKPLVTFVILFMTPLQGMGIDIYTPSLPHIVQYFSADPIYVKLTLAVYLLGYGIGQPFFGTLSDSKGRKNPFFWGMVCYVILTMLCSFAPNITTLIVLRFLQGITIAACGTITKAILADSFKGKMLAKRSSYMATAWALGPIVAPAIGGYLQFYVGWQANFLFLAAYALLGLVFIRFLLPETNEHLIPWNLKNTNKTYLEILAHFIFIGAVICMTLVYSLIILFNIVGPFVIQEILKYSAITYGHVAFIMGFAFFLGTLSNRFMLHKRDPHHLIPFGIILMLISSVVMILFAVALPVNLYTLIIPTFVTLYASGFVFPNAMGKCLSLFPKRAGSASALMGSLFIFGTGIVAAFGSLLKTESLVPYALAYLILQIIAFLIYWFIFRRGLKNPV